MLKIKKIVSVILTVLLVAAICAPAFAAEEYDYTADERFKVQSDTDNGEFAWGVYSPAYYHVISKKVQPLGTIPKVVDEETGEETDKDLYEDSLSCLPENEIIRIAAYYVFQCPGTYKDADGNETPCGAYHGAYRIQSFYSLNNGKCSHCGKSYPNPSELKIYRFIVVDESAEGITTHTPTMRDYDFTKYAKDVYGSTASLYEGGKDLPESCIDFVIKSDDIVQRSEAKDDYAITPPDTLLNKEDYIRGIDPTGKTKPEFGDRFMAWLLTFLSKLQYKLTPVLNGYANSAWAEFKYNLRVKLAGIWETVLTALVS